MDIIATTEHVLLEFGFVHILIEREDITTVLGLDILQAVADGIDFQYNTLICNDNSKF